MAAPLRRPDATPEANPSPGLLVRCGPPPLETEDELGGLHSGFLDYYIIPLGVLWEVARAGGLPPPPPDIRVRPDFPAPDFLALVVSQSLWPTALRQGQGHILVGFFSRMEYFTRGVPPPCGFALSSTFERSVAPAGYVPLYAVARGPDPPEGGGDRVDLVADYRPPPGAPPPEVPSVLGLVEKKGGVATL